MNGLLNGINILDFGRAAVGPWAASLLGSMGANVIRVESPDGDGLLKQQPLQRGYAVAYAAWNANKKGLILDLKSPDSEPHFRRLGPRQGGLPWPGIRRPPGGELRPRPLCHQRIWRGGAFQRPPSIGARRSGLL